LSSRSYIAALAAGVLASAACAADYPSRPIRFIVPSAAGGAPDYLVRALTQELAGVLNQQIVVDNRAGASGVIGVELIAHAPADGYTLGYGNAPLLAILPSLNPKLTYDVARDLQPIARYNFSQNILAVRTSLPVTSVKELIDYARKNPGRLSYASPGNGTTVHLSAELFKQMTGTNMLHVPYTSIAQALTELIAGQVDLVFDNLTSTAPHVKAGRLRGIAVTGPARTPILPDLPTVAEAGVPGYESGVWFGIMVPAATPKDVIARLNAAAVQAAKAPEFIKRMTDLGYNIIPGTPEDMAKMLDVELKRWAPIVKASGAKVD
jgi:tripartite-type tricarboxylate transporter receptor subunit TctC